MAAGDVTYLVNGSILRLQRGDITTLAVDAIVNAANSGLVPGGGVDGAIHRAGGPSIAAETYKIGGCPTGSAVVTGAGRLSARYVIHAVAPRWRGGFHGESDALRSAYATSLRLAGELQIESIAFPSLGTGIYGYPIDQASEIALSTAIEYLQTDSTVKHVIFVLFSQADFDTYTESLARLTAT